MAGKAKRPEPLAAAADAELLQLLAERFHRHPERHPRHTWAGPFDQKTSSWLATPAEIRAHGGALFGDFRYGTVFVYHNGAASYFAARGCRFALRV